MEHFEFQSPFVTETQCMNLGVVISVCLNMCLPLGMDSHSGTLFVAMVPSQMGEVKSAQLQALKHPPETQQPGLLQRIIFQIHLGDMFSQLVIKNE